MNDPFLEPRSEGPMKYPPFFCPFVCLAANVFSGNALRFFDLLHEVRGSLKLKMTQQDCLEEVPKMGRK